MPKRSEVLFMSEEKVPETSVPETEEVECLPCEALNHLCAILPDEEGKKVCEEIKIGLENETMNADEARELLASKVGRHVLATKLAEVSVWIDEQYTKRQKFKEKLDEVIPLEEPAESLKEELPPLPEEMTKSLDEIAEPVLTPTYVEEKSIEEPKSVIPVPELDYPDDFIKQYDRDSKILYGDLDDSDIEDDPLYMYEDEDLWLQDGVVEE